MRSLSVHIFIGILSTTAEIYNYWIYFLLSFLSFFQNILRNSDCECRPFKLWTTKVNKWIFEKVERIESTAKTLWLGNFGYYILGDSLQAIALQFNDNATAIK